MNIVPHPPKKPKSKWSGSQVQTKHNRFHRKESVRQGASTKQVGGDAVSSTATSSFKKGIISIRTKRLSLEKQIHTTSFAKKMSILQPASKKVTEERKAEVTRSSELSQTANINRKTKPLSFKKRQSSSKVNESVRGQAYSVIVQDQKKETRMLLGVLETKLSPTSRPSAEDARGPSILPSTNEEKGEQTWKRKEQDEPVLTSERQNSVTVAKSKWKKLRMISKLAGVMKKSREDVESKQRRMRIIQRWDQVRRISKASILMAQLAESHSNENDYIDSGETYEKMAEILKKPPEHRSGIDIKFLMVVVNKLHFFSSLTTEQTREFCKCMKLEEIKTRYHSIFREGEIGERFYVIMKGAVHARVHNSAFGKAKNSTVRGYRVVNEMKAGEAFGGLALRVPGGRRTASVVSKVPSTLLWINRTTYNNIIQAKHEQEMVKCLQFVEKASCFQHTPHRVLEQLIPFGNTRRYSVDQCILKEGASIDSTACLILVRRGHCFVYKDLPSNLRVDINGRDASPIAREGVVERVKLCKLCPGDCLTDASNFGTDSREGVHVNYSLFSKVTIIAETCVEALVFSLHNLQSVLSSSEFQSIRELLPQYPTREQLALRLRRHLKWKETQSKIVEDILRPSKRGRNMLARRRALKALVVT